MTYQHELPSSKPMVVDPHQQQQQQQQKTNKLAGVASLRTCCRVMAADACEPTAATEKE
jgi:hypothetical protein